MVNHWRRCDMVFQLTEDALDASLVCDQPPAAIYKLPPFDSNC
jgi:hypothetical protein